MANCGCNISTRLLSPGVFNLKQYTNQTEAMVWTVSCRYCNSENTDLNDYDAFLVLQKGDGEVDEVALTKVVNSDDTITLTWNVGNYATWMTEYVKYQIVFRGSCVSGLGVLGCGNSDANGSYEIESELVDGTNRIWTNSTNSNYKINYDTTNSRWQLICNTALLAASNGTDAVNGDYLPNSATSAGTLTGTARIWTHGDYTLKYNALQTRWEIIYKVGASDQAVTDYQSSSNAEPTGGTWNGSTTFTSNNYVVDYQTFADSSPCRGTWGNIVVGNNTACVWESLEAVMYISDSIAADEHVSAKCPTILRQMWFGLRNLIIQSGVTVMEIDVESADWQGSSMAYYLDLDTIATIPAGCNICGVEVFKKYTSGNPEVVVYKKIFNSELDISSEYRRVLCPSNVDGKVKITVKGGNGYYVSNEE